MGDLRSFNVEGAVLAIGPSLRRDAYFAVSVVLTVAAAAPVGEVAAQPEADALEAFFSGKAGVESLPKALATVDITACLNGARARESARWMSNVDEQSFVDKAVDLLGQ